MARYCFSSSSRQPFHFHPFSTLWFAKKRNLQFARKKKKTNKNLLVTTEMNSRLFCLAVLALGHLFLIAEAQDDSPPNIVLFIVDDMVKTKPQYLWWLLCCVAGGKTNTAERQETLKHNFFNCGGKKKKNNNKKIKGMGRYFVARGRVHNRQR